MADLFQTLAARRTLSEMTAHIRDTIRHFPPDIRPDIATELIDRAARRGAITPTEAITLAAQFAEPGEFSHVA